MKTAMTVVEYNMSDLRRGTYLRDGLGLVRLLGGVSSDTLSLDALGFLVLLFIRSEEIDLIVVFIGGSLLGRSSRGNSEGLACGAGARERVELSGV